MIQAAVRWRFKIDEVNRLVLDVLMRSVKVVAVVQLVVSPGSLPQAAAEILERRINAFGLSETPVQPYGSRGNELLVELPGITEQSRIKNLLQSRAVLEWYSFTDGPSASSTKLSLRAAASCPAITSRSPPSRLPCQPRPGLVPVGQPSHSPRHRLARHPRSCRWYGPTCYVTQASVDPGNPVIGCSLGMRG